MTPEIAATIHDLKIYTNAWDNDYEEWQEKEYPLYKLLNAIHEYDMAALQFLLYHVAARALYAAHIKAGGSFGNRLFNTL
jgi:hypothetical protein